TARRPRGWPEVVAVALVARGWAPSAGHRRALLASAASIAPLSSRGLGRRPLMAETRVRIPVAVLSERPRNRAFRRLRGQGANRSANPTLGGRATSSTFARDNRLLGQPYGFEGLGARPVKPRV